MKVVILAGGFGTRLSEATDIKPKPMVEIGSKPILWHIMKLYSSFGFNDFVICLGYKGYIIKEYFANYYLHQSNITVDLIDNKIEFHSSSAEPWKITLIETGLNAMTGARIKRIQKYLDGGPFMLTYGDGVSDVNVSELLNYHKNNKKLVTLTAVQISGKFGTLGLDDDNTVLSFQEKSKDAGGWINGGFFVLEPEIFDYLEDKDELIWEREPIEKIAQEGQLIAYKHKGFWKCMDVLRDKIELDNLWNSGNAPWKTWE